MHVIPSVVTSFLKVQIADVNILFLFYSFRINLRIALLRKIIPVIQSATTRVVANWANLLLLKLFLITVRCKLFLNSLPSSEISRRMKLNLQCITFSTTETKPLSASKPLETHSSVQRK